MPSKVLKLDVLIASPGDALPARDAVEHVIHQWNDSRGDREGVILRPRRWETGSVALMGMGDSQSVINLQLVDASDIVIAVFYHRLGSATARAASGTAEEIERSVAAGKPVHIYFSEGDVPYQTDFDQFKALKLFRQDIQTRGLISTFVTVPE